MKFLNEQFYKEFYKTIEGFDFEEDEQVELDFDYLGERLIIHGIARFEVKEYCTNVPYGTYDDFTQEYSYEKELSHVEINKIEKV